MTTPQALSEADRRVVAGWAADCAERVLPLFEAEAPDDDRARDGIDRARAFSRGELDTAEQIRIRFVAGRAAGSAETPAAIAAARAAGQAAGVAHMGAHALGAAAYAAKAAALAATDSETARRREVEWQLGRLTPEAHRALLRLPLLGTDSAGPLGPGLLASGVLATTIRELQAALPDLVLPE
ncbi:putative immunity protein [Agromyces sp. NPDC060279]|uniref:putative immunity protein n=1 Tax=Agromyces sp. NPDC060279 TaxID=3347092 RepID=UPI00365110AB